MAKKTTRKRRPMPKHIYSIHQLRDFIRLHDDLQAGPDRIGKKRRGHYSTLVYRLKNKLEVPDLEDLDDDIRRVVAAFDKLQDACKMKKSTSVKLGSTHLLSVQTRALADQSLSPGDGLSPRDRPSPKSISSMTCTTGRKTNENSTRPRT